MKKKEWLIIVLILLAALLFKLNSFDNTIAETGSSWRQPDTWSLSVNFFEDKLNIFFPQLNYDGSGDIFVQLELQVLTFLTSLLFFVFGPKYLIARLVSYLIFSLSAVYLYKLVRLKKDLYQASFALLLYAFMPINYFYSRAIMPETTLLLGLTAGTYYFIKWYENERMKDLMFSALFIGLAITQKVHVGLIGLGLIILCYRKYGFGFIKEKKLWGFLTLALGPAITYFMYLNQHSVNIVTKIYNKLFLPNVLKSFLSEEAMQFYKEDVINEFTLVLVLLSVAGCLVMLMKKDYNIPILAAFMLFDVVLVTSVIKFNYYLIVLTPFIAYFASEIIFTLKKYIAWTLAGIVFVLVLYSSLDFNSERFKEDWTKLYAANIVQTYVGEDDLIVLGRLDPALFALSDRKGWRSNIKHYDYIPEEPSEEIAYFVSEGAKYYIYMNQYINGDDGSYKTYLLENFELIYNDDIVTIIELR